MVYRFVLAVIAAITLVPAGAEVYRVKPGADPNSQLTGSDWDTATNLRQALQLAGSGDEVWATSGLYRASRFGFRIDPGVSLYGGFDGTENSLAERDLSGVSSVMSGDIDGDDLGVGQDGIVGSSGQIVGDNAEPLLGVGGFLGGTALLDGFTVTGGGSHFGSAVSADGALIRNCRFVGNNGAIESRNSSCRVMDSSFVNNTAQGRGGAIDIRSGVLELTRCEFEGNQNTFEGGAVDGFGSDVVVANCRFYRNAVRGSGSSRGGALSFTGSDSAVVVNSVFAENHADSAGGAIAGLGAAIAVDSCMFINNTAGRGGAIELGVESVNNSVFWGNRVSGSGIEFRHCLIQGSGGSTTWNSDFGVDGGGNIDTDPRLLSRAQHFRPRPDSPLIDAGLNEALPTDIADLDHDGDTGEVIPYAAENQPRIGGASVDIGSFEHSGPLGSGFPEAALRFATGVTTATDVVGLAEFFDDTAVAFSILANDRPDLLAATVDPVGGEVALQFQSDAVGVATLYLGATDAAAATAGFELEVWVFPPVLHVAEGASGAGTGLSWADAMPTLREAMDLGGGGYQIWVKTGTYHTDVEGGSRSSNFGLRDELALFGGFAGVESALADRDLSMTPRSLLSADLGRDDLDPDGDMAPNERRDIVGENGYHVVTAYEVGSSAILDGFTLVGGMADDIDLLTRAASEDGHGGGIFLSDASPTIRNCVVRGNTALEGAGVSIFGGSPTFFNVVMERGFGMRGVEIREVVKIAEAAPTFLHCTFYGDPALSLGDRFAPSSPLFHNCIVWGSANRGAVVGDSEGSFSNSVIERAYFFGDVWDPDLGTDGGGNSEDDPMFLFGVPFGRIAAGSSAIDSASPVFVPADLDDLDGDGDVEEAYPYDLAGQPRTFGGAPDAGAFEYLPALTDSDRDGLDDAFEISLTGNATGVQLPTLSLTRTGGETGLVITADARLEGQVTLVLEGSPDLGVAGSWGVLDWTVGSNGVVEGVWRVEMISPPVANLGETYFLRLRLLVP